MVSSVSHLAHSAIGEMITHGKSCSKALYAVSRNARLNLRNTLSILNKIKSITSDEANFDP